MDPVTLMTVGTIATAASTALGAVATSQAMTAQAKVGMQTAEIEKSWSTRRANEETAAAQRSAGDRLREGKLANSRLQALAAASGSGASDPTVLDLAGDISGEASLNARKEEAAGAQKASGLKFQGDLGLWKADAEQRIAKAGSKYTLIGGLLGAAGKGMTGMSARYKAPIGPWSTTTYKYG